MKPVEFSQVGLDDVFVELQGFLGGHRVWLKMEKYHPTGSIKYKTALEILDSLEAEGRLHPGDHIVESSSGNLGVALAWLCRQRGYRFTCVVDPNGLADNMRRIREHGGVTAMVTQRDPGGGYLAARLARVRELLAADPGAIWTNQYANPANARAHARHTAPAVLRNVPDLDVLMVGAGTTGTLLGCMQHLRVAAPQVKVVAVDSIGSVTFGGQPHPRKLPGIGSAVRPALADEVDALGRPACHLIPEPDTIAMCRRLRDEHNVLVGASTGTVVCGLVREAQRHPPGTTFVALSPDGGERYLDTVFNDDWVRQAYPDEELCRA
ncbi:MAG: 2,3-diaminopropionate biosynthesis protein SbnA [Pseudomonadota bacterium]|jgi:cysteine synthase A